MINFSLLLLVSLLFGFIFIFGKLAPAISGKIYERIYQFFKWSYFGSLLPIKFFYFIYFPVNANCRYDLKQMKFDHKIKQEGVYKITNHVENIKDLRFKNVRASILHSPASTFSIILSYIGFITSFIIFWLDRKEAINVPLITLVIICFSILLALILPLPFYLRYYILNLPLEEYASLIKSTLNESEMISHISYKIYEVCNLFEKETIWLKNNNYLINKEASLLFYKESEELKVTNDLKKDLEARVSGIEKNAKNLQRLLLALQIIERDLQRISILISSLSMRLKVSEVELCEHLFQFSPTMYKAWSKKFTDNLSVAIDLKSFFPNKESQNYAADSIKTHALDRIRSLLFECNRFVDRNIAFKRFQCQNLAFRDMHSNVIGFMTNKSSCEAVKIYIKALRDIFNSLEDQLDKKSDNFNKDCFIEKFKYIFFKRKAHAGLDLHFSAERLLNDMIQQDVIKNDQIKSCFNIRFLEDNLKSNDMQKAEELYLKITSEVSNLIQFYTYTVPYIEKCRQNVRSKFLEKLNEFIPNKKGETIYLITFGYSKIVRDVIKYAIPKYAAKEIKKLRIIIFLSESESTIDARLIKYNLTEEKNSGYQDALVSNPEFLLPLLTKDSRLIILIGAEAFDEQKRIIRTNEYKSCFKKFLFEAMKIVEGVNINSQYFQKEALNEAKKIKVWVCAESFKQNKDLSEIQEFFDDQYEKVEMYEADYISEIIHD